VDSARQFFTQKHYDAAITAANAALLFDPANPEARLILNRSQTILNRRQRQAQTPRTPLPSETVAAATPAVPSTPGPRSPGEPSAPAAATTASLRIHLVSDFPDGGVLIISVNGKELMRKDFDGSRRGFFLSRRPPERRDLSWPFEVSTSTGTVHVHIAPKGKPAFVKDYPVYFTGGSSHAVEIQLSAEGRVTEVSLH
jgi:hypothetical protein